MPEHLRRAIFQTQETLGLGNDDFLETIAEGYRYPGASIRVVRDESFENTAQPKWAEMLRVNNKQLYNGAAVDPVVEEMRDTYTRYRFAASDICNCRLGLQALRPVQWLDALAAPSADAA